MREPLRKNDKSIDVLFVTRVSPSQETGEASVYRPLRLEILGRTATLSVLRDHARALCGGHLDSLVRRPGRVQHDPVLTPIYMKQYLGRRNITLAEVECLEHEQERARAILDAGVHVIALCTTWISGQHPAQEVRRAAALLRSMAPDTPIVVGGAAVRKGLRVRALRAQDRLRDFDPETLASDYLLVDAVRDRDLDAVVTSEGGEEVLAAIVARLRAGQDFRDLPNLAIPAAKDFAFTPEEPGAVDLDAEVVDWTVETPEQEPRPAHVWAGRGCPLRCAFCEFTGMYRFAQRSCDSILAELRAVARAPATQRAFAFTDENIAASKPVFGRLMRAMVAERLGLRWKGFVRADAVDTEFAQLMRDSGCVECHLGIESGDPEVLRNMNKHLDPVRAVRAVELLDRVGISTMCSFIVGFPGECSRSVEKTAQVVSSFPSGGGALARHRYYLFRFQLGALCPVAEPEQRARFGLRGSAESWSHDTMTSDEACAAVRDLFLQIRGPAHVYREAVPPEWDVGTLRHITELRDEVQKNRLRGHDENGLERLLDAVRQADGAANST